MATENPLPTRLCDVVMKGGITSGVVYPLAVYELSKAFRFKNIGGTSAGAIAAAAAAAAELGRHRGAGGGFERLAQLPQFLSARPAGESRTHLFAFSNRSSERCAFSTPVSRDWAEARRRLFASFSPRAAISGCNVWPALSPGCCLPGSPGVRPAARYHL